MIYFIQDTNSKAIKIGVSKKPTQRITELQTAHPAKLVLLAVMDGMQQKEHELHQRFTRKHGEWFEPTSDLLRFIRTEAIPIAVPGITQQPAQPSTKPNLIERLYVLRDATLVLAYWLMTVGCLGYAVYKLAVLSAPTIWSIGYVILMFAGAFASKCHADRVARPYRAR